MNLQKWKVKKISGMLASVSELQPAKVLSSETLMLARDVQIEN